MADISCMHIGSMHYVQVSLLAQCGNMSHKVLLTMASKQFFGWPLVEDSEAFPYAV
jgi:hypothetical protein